MVALAELVGKVVTLGLLRYAVRVLAPAEFGAFAYALAFGLLLAVLPAWGLDALMVQQVGPDKSRLPGQFGQLLVLRSLIAVPVLVMGAAVGLVERSGADARFALIAMLVAALAESYAHAPRAVAGVLRRQSSVAVVLIIQRLTTALVAGALLAAGLGLIGLCAAYMVVTLIGTAALFVTVARAGARPSLLGLSWRELRSTARKSVPLGVDALVAMMLFRIDAVLLGWFHGDTAVAEYTAPYRLVEAVLFVGWAVARVTYPTMAAAAENPPAVLRSLTAGLAATAFFFVPYAVLLMVRGEDILQLFFGDYYADKGTLTLQVLAPTPLLFACGFLFSYAFVARGRSGIALLTSLVAGTVNVVANLLLLPPFSTLGAAATTTGSYLLEAILLAILAHKRLGPVRLTGVIVLPVLSSLPAAAAAALLPLSVLPALLVFGFVYVMLWGLAARKWQPGNLSVLLSVLPHVKKT
jgi:O-antigen/teichoic acid export membrane protein